MSHHPLIYLSALRGNRTRHTPAEPEEVGGLEALFPSDTPELCLEEPVRFSFFHTASAAWRNKKPAQKAHHQSSPAFTPTADIQPEETKAPIINLHQADPLLTPTEPAEMQIGTKVQSEGQTQAPSCPRLINGQLKPEPEQQGDLSSVDYLVLNNRILSNSIANLAENYFKKAALEEIDKR